MLNRNSDQPKIIKGSDRDCLVLPTMAFTVTMIMIDSNTPTSLGNLLKEKSQPTKYVFKTQVCNFRKKDRVRSNTMKSLPQTNKQTNKKCFKLPPRSLSEYLWRVKII